MATQEPRRILLTRRTTFAGLAAEVARALAAGEPFQVEGKGARARRHLHRLLASGAEIRVLSNDEQWRAVPWDQRAHLPRAYYD